MTLSPTQTLITIAAIALGAIVTRALPFLLFPDKRQPPAYIQYLGNVLPAAVIGMLVVYCLKGATPLAFPFGLPEAIAILCIVALHKWRHNSLLSIGGGTAVYMLLVQVVFV